MTKSALAKIRVTRPLLKIAQLGVQIRLTMGHLYFPTTLPHANGEAREAGKNPNEIPILGEYADRDWPDSQKEIAAMISRLARTWERFWPTSRNSG